MAVKHLLLMLFGYLASSSDFIKPGYSVHEQRDHSLDDLIKRDELDPMMLLPVRIGLVQENLDKGHDLLMDMSDPSSPNYGKHYSQKEVLELFAPRDESVKLVKQWIESAGFSGPRVSLSANKQWLQFEAKVFELEKLLHTKYSIYKHTPSAISSIGCDEYSIPGPLQKHIDYITPGLKHLRLRPDEALSKRQSRSTKLLKRTSTGKPIITDEFCDLYFTPKCARDLYNITLSTQAHPGNSLGIYETYGDGYNQADLNGFYKNFFPRIPQHTGPTINSIDGGKTNLTRLLFAGFESTLDLEVAYPIVYPQKIKVFQVNDHHYAVQSPGYPGIFNTFLDAIDGSYCTLSKFNETGNNPKYDPPYPDNHRHGYNHPLQCGVFKPTNVISISYFVGETLLSVNYQRRQCYEWMKLGLQGVSVFIASGDLGVAGAGYPEGHGKFGCIGPQGRVFAPGSPVNCPYITVVGGTQLRKGSKTEETASRDFGSGGGFSNIFGTPGYQKSHVESYLKHHTPPYKSYSAHLNKSFATNGGLFNRNGRAFPDVAAISINWILWLEEEPFTLGGTSASTPLWAAIATRINDERLAKNKSTIGFINPVLYKNAHLLTDITEGNNPGCRTKGFSAAKGWDPVTGLGTPDYGKLLDLFLSLP